MDQLPKPNYQINWLNSNDEPIKIHITKDKVFMYDRCAPYLPISIDEIREPHKCLKDTKIINAYHNRRGGDFIIYDNGLISDINYENKVGKIMKL
jgi:hypothetical protein